ncbi:MAG: hypothetical protein Q9218_003815 [Villophora microphyllina]
MQTFADAQPIRVNQFEIAARFAGLEERFRIFNNDELADALRIRLNQLHGELNRSTPEVLSLLLLLSDRPLEETRFADLDEAKPEFQDPPLTWSDIIADDPLEDDDSLWDNVDFARDGSDDDADSVVPALSQSRPTSESSSDVEDIPNAIKSLTVPPDSDGLTDLLKSQYWTRMVNVANTVDGINETDDHPGIVILSETQCIREVGSMLLGLPSTIYEQQRDGKLALSSRYRLEHLSPSTFLQLLDNFARTGDELARIRTWKHRDERYPLTQTFQACIVNRLNTTESGLAHLQTRLLRSNGDTTSILSYHEEAQSLTRQLRHLIPVMIELDQAEKAQPPFRVLEILYNRACMNDSVGDAMSFRYLSEIFLACLQTYLKPLRHWMEQGELSRYDQATFIRESKSTVDLDLVWADRFTLSVDASGQLHAPMFLRLAAQKILNTGKSVHFLRLLGHSTEVDQAKEQGSMPIDMQSLCGSESDCSLDSFPERFAKVLDGWIASSYHLSSALLKRLIENQYGLYRALDALEFVYLSRDEQMTNIIADALFSRIDRGRDDWNDVFLLTDLFRSTFISKRCIKVANLNVRTTAGSSQPLNTSRRSVAMLETVCVTYTLPWPVANIITRDTMRIYQRISILLLQVKRAKQMLERRFLRNVLLALMKDDEGSRAILLRQRMLCCLNTILSYLTDVVLTPATADMREKIAEADDLDEMIAVHQAYTARLCEQCLISKDHTSTLKAITSLLDIVILFTDTCLAHVGDSAPTKPKQLQDSRVTKRQVPQRVAHGIESSSDEEESDAGKELDILHTVRGSESSATKLSKMHDTFYQLHTLIIVGLRNVSKGGEDTSADILANLLATG